MRMFVALALAFLMSGCTSLKEKAGCFVEDKMTAIGTDFVVSKLQCSNSFAIHADLGKVVDKIGLCEEKQTGLIADIACPSISKAIVESVAGGIPAEWGCKATDAKALASEGLLAICKLIPVSQFAPEK